MCTDCLAGTYSAVSGQLHCDGCTGGKYASAAGSSDCTHCSIGKFSQESETGCSDCAAGKHNTVDGSAECKDIVTYTVAFKGFNYMFENELKYNGWKLLTAGEVVLLSKLLVAQANQNGGISMVASFEGAGCCIALAAGQSLVADGDLVFLTNDLVNGSYS